MEGRGEEVPTVAPETLEAAKRAAITWPKTSNFQSWFQALSYALVSTHSLIRQGCAG